MNDKDKSYFIKLVLAVFVFFLIMLGLTAQLVKNKRFVNQQSQFSVTPPAIVNNTINDLLLAEVQKLEKEGVSGEKYQIKSKIEFQTDSRDYLLAIFEIDFKESSIYDITKIYGINNNVLTDLYEEKGSYINKTEIKDINKDGIPEIILYLSTGGNCSGCDSIKILRIKNQKVENIKINFPDKVTPQGLADLKNDSSEEIIGIDTSWDFYSNVCHACSPGVEVIAEWDGNAYQMASDKFPDFYNNKIKGIETELKNPFDEQYYFGDLISLLLNYIVKGEKETGFTEFKKYAESYKFESPKLEAEILRIKKDLDKWIKEEGIDKLLPNENFIFISRAYKNTYGSDYDLGYIDDSLNNGELFISKTIINPYDKNTTAIIIQYKDKGYSHGVLIIDNKKKILSNQYILIGALEHLYLSDVKWVAKDALSFNSVVIDEGGVAKKPQILKADETADWKTYKNEDMGFEVKYPIRNWTISKFHDDNCIVTNDKDQKNCIRFDTPFERIIINMSNFSAKENLNKFLEFQQNDVPESYRQKEEEILLGGHKGYKFYSGGWGEVPGEGDTIYLEKDKTSSFEISYSFINDCYFSIETADETDPKFIECDNSVKQESAMIEKILSTFKFIN